jgi:hypothetical protein
MVWQQSKRREICRTTNVHNALNYRWSWRCRLSRQRTRLRRKHRQRWSRQRRRLCRRRRR